MKIIFIKWNIITHNIRGLNDLESILKEWCFLNSLTPREYIVIIEEQNLSAKHWKIYDLDSC